MSRDRTWLLISKKLAGEANAAELQELEELLRNDPDMYYALQHVTDLWNLPAKEQDDVGDALSRHINRMQQSGIDFEQLTAPSPSHKKIWIIGLAASIVLAAGIYLYYARLQPAAHSSSLVATPTRKTKSISTRNGARQHLLLPDGSSVWLNAGSRLLYDTTRFGDTVREVELSGEAFFDVVSVHQPAASGGQAIPFIIHTPQIDVHVLGTAFNVKSYPGDAQTETSLVRGKVEVTIHNRSNEKIILRPNEKLVVANDPATEPADGTPAYTKSQPIVSLSKLSYTGPDSIVAETAWIYNKLAFDNESFAEVAAKMERWYNVQFVFGNKQTQQLRFTGVFEKETLQQALDYMAITAPFHYSITNSKVIIDR